MNAYNRVRAPVRYWFTTGRQATRYKLGTWPMNLDGRRLQIAERMRLLGFAPPRKHIVAGVGLGDWTP